MIPTADPEEYLKLLLDAPRPNLSKVLAFYDHRVGKICQDPKLMLLPLDDHLVHRGDGVFETMKYVGRKVYQLDAHLQRLKRSSRAIHLTPSCDFMDMAEMCLDVARAGGISDGMVRILLGRGPGGFGIDPNECPLPSLYIVAYRSHPVSEAKYAKGVTAFKTSVPAKQPYMATIKSVNYLPNMLMKRESVEKEMDYSLCFDEHGCLAEGATENVCIVTGDGKVVVPEFTNALAGTTMLRAVELIQDEMEVVFRPIRENEIFEAKEVIVAGTTTDAISIVRYNGKPIHDVAPGPVSKRMRELLVKDLKENGVPF